jgi:hypothetical protein
MDRVWHHLKGGENTPMFVIRLAHSESNEILIESCYIGQLHEYHRDKLLKIIAKYKLTFPNLRFEELHGQVERNLKIWGYQQIPGNFYNPMIYEYTH